MILTEREFADTLSILTDFKKNLRLVCAFSGGADSLALLIACVKTLGAENVVPVYVNHNLRSENELRYEVEINKKNCDKLGVQLIVQTIDKGIIERDAKLYGGVEASARKHRYEILNKCASEFGCSFIATAHHNDDQLETVLMKIISHGPVTSLRGISERNGNIIRPLLEFDKKTLESYVKDEGFKWSTDSTNSDNSIRRNELRNKIIPQLATVMPDWKYRVENIRKYAVSQCIGIFDFKDSISLDKFCSYNDSQKLMVLYSMWDNTVGTSMPQTLAKRVIENIEKGFAIEGAAGGIFCIHKGFLYLVKEGYEDQFSEFETVFVPQGVTYLPDNSCIECVKGGNNKDLRLDTSLFEGRAVVRYVRVGDSIKLKDGTKKVLRLLQDLDVPPVLRFKVPVIADEKEVCAVFASVFGSNDRICLKMRTSLAQLNLYSYIYKKG